MASTGVESGVKKQATLLNHFKKSTTPEAQGDDVSPKAEPILSLLPAGLQEFSDIFCLDGIHESWIPCFQTEFSKPYFVKLATFLRSELRQGSKVFPPSVDVFSWARLCPLPSIKVAILGQDPYHDDGQAHGLAFSVRKGVAFPPSLRNIWKELEADLGYARPKHGCLEGWARQGVLLLNTSLTVRAHQAASHAGRGWETFTDAVLQFVSLQVTKPAVFILWGGHAQKRAPMISKKGHGHLILQSAHPSPLSAHRGFFGSRCFSKSNEFLKNNGHEPVNWIIED